jgi:HD superfamily phosphohydrolase
MSVHEINDGIDRVYVFSDLVKRLLDTPEVQRTENIINNGLCCKTYPAIKYSRKGHMLGVAKAGKKLFEALNKNGANLSDNYLNLFEAVGILHDVGHPPFAHSLRKIISEMGHKEHEEVSAQIITGELSFYEYFSKKPHLLGDEPYIKSILDEYKNLERIPDILQDFNIDPQLLVQAIHEDTENNPILGFNKFVQEAIDGSLFDIDKMEYLSADSKLANISEGKANPSRILNEIKLVKFNGKSHLAVSDKTLDDICSWVIARKYMYTHVYTHKTVLKYEAMLSEAVRQAMPFLQKKDYEIHLLSDDQLMSLLMKANKKSANLALHLQYGRQFKYDDAFVINSDEVIPENESYDLLNKIYSINNNTTKTEIYIKNEISKIASKKVNLEDHELIVYMPYKLQTPEDVRKKLDLHVYSKKNPSIVDTLVNVYDGKSKIQNIYATAIFNALSKPQTSVYFTVYTPKKYSSIVRDATKEFLKNI